MTGELRVHPSSLGAWCRCERRADFEFSRPRPRGPEHIAGWVGTAVHALMAGQEPPPLPEPATYDHLTTSPRMARAQARAIAFDLREAVAPLCMTPLACEVAVRSPLDGAVLDGRADLALRLPETPERPGRGPLALLDYKTGRRADHALVQLGAYALAIERAGLFDGDPVESLIVARRPRGPKGGPAAVEIRPAPPAVADAAARVSRVADVLSRRAEPLPSPGPHCQSCPVPACGCASPSRSDRPGDAGP